MSKQDQNDLSIRAAMDRLLAGNSLHTDGQLHVKNLAAEAGLSRQQVYRSSLLTEFTGHVERLRAREVEPTQEHLKRIQRLQEELKTEREKAAKYRAERDQAIELNSALANQIQLLDSQLQQAAKA